MKQKIVIKAHMTCDKCRKSALALAASTYGVQSVGIEGEERDQLVVVGVGVDATSLTSCLRKKVKVGRADIVKVEVVVDKEAAKPAADKTPATPVVAEWPAQWYPYHHPGYYCPQPGVVYPSKTLAPTRKEMIIRVHTSSEKGHGKAIKVAAAISGVESVTLAGEDKNLLLVIGVGIDSDRITKKLRRKVGHAEVVELRTVDGAKDDLGSLVAADHAYGRYHPSPSPYKQHHHAGARDHYYGAGGSPYARQMAPGSYYYGGSGGGGAGYPAQSYQQHGEYLYQYHPATTANTHTVVHHEYASDPNSCSVM